MRYIDAEKLKELINEKYREFRLKGFKEDSTYYYYADGLDLAEQLIDSLQQEQSKVDLEKKATQLSQKYFPDEENIWAKPNIEAQKCKSACIEMVEWLKTQKEE